MRTLYEAAWGGYSEMARLRDSTVVHLAKEHGDQGHLGHFAADALRTCAATAEELDEALAGHIDLNVLLAMAEK